MADTMPRVTASWMGCTEPESRQDIAEMPFLEEVGRQAQQVPHQVADHLEAQELAEDFQRIVAQRLDAGLHQHQRAEPQRQHREQIGIGPEDCVVDHEL
jgi:hypothetical protein